MAVGIKGGQLHHKIPKFLGGTNDYWNMEVLSNHEHFLAHLDWAEQLDTYEAWKSCISFFQFDFITDEQSKRIKERYGYFFSLPENNPSKKGQKPWNKGLKQGPEVAKKAWETRRRNAAERRVRS